MAVFGFRRYLLTHLCDGSWLVDFLAVRPAIQTTLQGNFTHIDIHVWYEIILGVVSYYFQVKPRARAALLSAIDCLHWNCHISPHFTDAVIFGDVALVRWRITYKYYVGANKTIRENADGQG